MIFERDLTIYIETKEESLFLADYKRDDVNFSLLDSQFFYVGLYKPFNQLYWEFVTPDTNGVVLTVEYWNGTAFSPLNFLSDSTLNWSRSGFQNWTKSDDWSSTVINGDDLFWIRLSVDITTSSIDLRATNLLYADDNDLSKENSTISRFLPSGDISFAPLHERVRDDVVQLIRNRGQSTRKTNADFARNITKWDFLDFNEIRQASIYYALEKIYFAASDGTDDKWLQRSKINNQMANEAMNMFFLSLDKDDDGQVDTDENLLITAIQVTRI